MTEDNYIMDVEIASRRNIKTLISVSVEGFISMMWRSIRVGSLQDCWGRVTDLDDIKFAMKSLYDVYEGDTLIGQVKEILNRVLMMFG